MKNKNIKEFTKQLVGTIFFIGAFIVIFIATAYVVEPVKAAPLFPEIPIEEEQLEKNTVIELSEDGVLADSVKVPYGSTIHIIIANGKTEVRLNQATIPFNKN